MPPRRSPRLAAQASNGTSAPERDSPVVLMMGVCGSGKSSVGEKVAENLGLGFQDADDFHPAANKAKMASGTPLTDEDRWPWLDAMGKQAAQCARQPMGSVLACSALKRVYRARLKSYSPSLIVVFLDVPAPVLRARIAARKHHFMPASLIDSQLATLETPTTKEGFNILVVVPPSLASDFEGTVAFICEQVKRGAGRGPSRTRSLA